VKIAEIFAVSSITIYLGFFLRHQLHSFDIDLAASKKQCFDGI
jgi:uncharacterized membrane protein